MACVLELKCATLLHYTITINRKGYGHFCIVYVFVCIVCFYCGGMNYLFVLFVKWWSIRVKKVELSCLSSTVSASSTSSDRVKIPFFLSTGHDGWPVTGERKDLFHLWQMQELVAMET